MSKINKSFFLNKNGDETAKDKATYFEDLVLDDNKLVLSTIGEVISVKKENETD